jgi:sugar phosphate isomerase/epimerase
LSGDLSALAANVEAIGAQYVVAPVAWLPDRALHALGPGTSHADMVDAFKSLSAEDWKHTAGLLNKHGEALARFGKQLAYHNHNIEFLPLPDGKTGFDLLVEHSDPRRVFFEVDLGWVVAGGQDPVKLLTRLGSRVKLLHMKDTKGVSAEPLDMVPADVGTGVVPWTALVPVIRHARIPHLFVEQEPPFPTSPMQAARVAYKFLSGTFQSGR